MKKLKKDTVITVIARRWFERVNGNTYHSCEVYINGELLERDAFSYGYGEHYNQTAMEILSKHYDLQGIPMLWRLRDIENKNIKIITSCTDVERKKDL